jgi:hypothetical protein
MPSLLLSMYCDTSYNRRNETNREACREAGEYVGCASRMCIVLCKQNSRPVKVNLSKGGQSVIVACFPSRVRSVRNAIATAFKLEWNTRVLTFTVVCSVHKVLIQHVSIHTRKTFNHYTLQYSSHRCCIILRGRAGWGRCRLFRCLKLHVQVRLSICTTRPGHPFSVTVL